MGKKSKKARKIVEEQIHNNVQANEVGSSPTKAVVVETPTCRQPIETKIAQKKQKFSRIALDPSKAYSTPESREAWGKNVKGKVFRKEKGKKKRCPAAGIRIDGAVNSIRFD